MPSERPLCIDLFCGYGGWARGFLDAGYRVVGFDNEPKCARKYPGEFVLADIRGLDGSKLDRAHVIVASPPCTEFSVMANLRRAMHGIEPDPEGKGMDLVLEALRVIYEAEPAWWCLENVRGAEEYIGKPRARNGPQVLFGYFPGFIASPTRKGHIVAAPRGRDFKWRDSRLRAMIPYPLARSLADACLPDADPLHDADAGRSSLAARPSSF